MMRAADIGWLAGIVDGEGWIGLDERVRRNDGVPTNSPILEVTMCDEDALLRCEAITGLGNVRPVARQSENHKPAWRWTLQGSPAVQVLQTIWPLLTERRQARAAEVITAWRRKPPRKSKFDGATELFCPGCRETKAMDEFYRCSSRASGRQGYCKPCQSERYFRPKLEDKTV